MSEHTDCEQDTREQLEVDLNNLCLDCLGLWWNAANDLKKAIRKLLDRQAAITTAYCTSEDESFCDACRAAQKRKIAELTAERDNLQAAIDAMNNGQFYAMYKAKCEECELLKKVVRTQAESFKKLECELAGKDG